MRLFLFHFAHDEVVHKMTLEVVLCTYLFLAEWNPMVSAMLALDVVAVAK